MRLTVLALASSVPELRMGSTRRMTRLESELMVPSKLLPTAVAAEQLADWLRGKRRVVILTGAGVSTGSGIPDYRGDEGAYRKGHVPMSHDQFLSRESNRRRYWSRALRGYEKFAASQPNEAHLSIAALQRLNIASFIITQNVDGLHERVNDESVVALHGRGDRCVCVNCGHLSDRKKYHDLLKKINGISDVNMSQKELRPDGDAEIDDMSLDDFLLPPCDECEQGILKPDVVFFGDSVPKSRVDACFHHIDEADGLLCCGSTLAVYSAFRFVLRARDNSLPICVLNKGKTRADVEQIRPLLKLDADLRALPLALDLLSSSS